MKEPCDSHWNVVIQILWYLKNAPGCKLIYGDKGNAKIVRYFDADWAGSPSDRRSTCVLIRENLISWRSKKQKTVARFNAKAEYRAMAAVAFEITWLRQLLQQLKFGDTQDTRLLCDNQVALHISSNPIFHERTKHIEIDCHFVREKVLSGEIIIDFVNSGDQLADMLTRYLKRSRVENICNKLGSYDICSSLRGSIEHMIWLL